MQIIYDQAEMLVGNNQIQLGLVYKAKGIQVIMKETS